MNIKNSLFWEWKNNFVFSDSDLFSVLRVLLLITVNMDHPVVNSQQVMVSSKQPANESKQPKSKVNQPKPRGYS